MEFVNLQSDKKLMLDMAIGSMNDEFFERNNRHPHLDELPDFVGRLRADTGKILEIIDERNSMLGLPWPLSKEIDRKYPTFWDDFWRNLELERIPRSLRPDRTVT